MNICKECGKEFNEPAGSLFCSECLDKDDDTSDMFGLGDIEPPENDNEFGDEPC